MSTSLNGTTGRLPAPVGRPEASNGVEGGGAASAVLLVILAIASLFLMQGDLNQRILLTLCVATTLYALLSFAPTVGVCASLVFLSFLGGFKRWLIPVLGFQSFDPFMLVMPAVIGLLFIPHLLKRRIPTDTLLSKLILALLIVMLLEMVNPFQGGIAIGVAGALYYVVPLLWYYFGRFSGSPQLLRAVFSCAFVIALVTGLYGQYQQFFGLLPSEILWTHYTGWTLGLGSTIKVFSTFCSTAEYAGFLEIGIVLSFVGVLRRQTFFILTFIGFFLMLFFSGSRGPVLLALSGCAAIWAVQGVTQRAWLPRLIAAGLFTAFALIFSLSSINVAGIKSNTAHDVVEHQVAGLLNPLAKNETGGAHLGLIGSGIIYGFTHPLGGGLGATTLATRLRGGDESNTSDASGTENDLPNMFVSLGAGGGLLYFAVMIVVMRMVLNYWHTTRDKAVLSLLGVMVCQVGLWLMGSHYAESALVWVCVGTMDRMQSNDLVREKRKAASMKATKQEAAVA